MSSGRELGERLFQCMCPRSDGQAEEEGILMESPECVLIGKWKHQNVQIYWPGISKKWGTTWGSLAPLQLFVWCPDSTSPPSFSLYTSLSLLKSMFWSIWVLLLSAIWVLFQTEITAILWQKGVKVLYKVLPLSPSLPFFSFSSFFLFFFFHNPSHYSS